jgi:hypothetical protein
VNKSTLVVIIIIILFSIFIFTYIVTALTTALILVVSFLLANYNLSNAADFIIIIRVFIAFLFYTFYIEIKSYNGLYKRRKRVNNILLIKMEKIKE